jgi:hypothetical protein
MQLRHVTLAVAVSPACFWIASGSLCRSQPLACNSSVSGLNVFYEQPIQCLSCAGIFVQNMYNIGQLMQMYHDMGPIYLDHLGVGPLETLSSEAE